MAGSMLGNGLEEVREHWMWFFFAGSLLIVLGCIAIGSSVAVTMASMMLIGWVLIFGGLFQIIHGIARRRWNGFFLNLLAGALYVAVGFLILANPAAAAATLTLTIALFLIVSGGFRLLVAFSTALHHRGWLILSGVIAILLGLSIWDQWPLSGMWVIGLFIGIDLIFEGWSEVMLAMTARNLGARPSGYGFAPH